MREKNAYHYSSYDNIRIINFDYIDDVVTANELTKKDGRNASTKTWWNHLKGELDKKTFIQVCTIAYL